MSFLFSRPQGRCYRGDKYSDAAGMLARLYSKAALPRVIEIKSFAQEAVGQRIGDAILRVKSKDHLSATFAASKDLDGMFERLFDELQREVTACLSGT